MQSVMCKWKLYPAFFHACVCVHVHAHMHAKQRESKHALILNTSVPWGSTIIFIFQMGYRGTNT